MKIFTPATSANLGPGFDCLGLSLGLFNEVEILPQNFTQITINGEGAESLGLKKNNSFVNIFNQIFFELSGKRQNFRFNFTNNIPFSRGLGSSSSTIIGAIAAAFCLAGFGINRAKILNRALEFENHPDNIAPAAFGGFCANIIRGGEVFTQRADLDENLRAVVVIPDTKMGTSQSRQILPKNYPTKDAVSNISHASFMTACFIKKDYENLRLACVDKMHEDIRMAGLKELFLVRKIAYENGALLSSLSGSGSSFLNLAYKNDANKLKSALTAKFPQFRIEIFALDNGGFSIV